MVEQVFVVTCLSRLEQKAVIPTVGWWENTGANEMQSEHLLHTVMRLGDYTVGDQQRTHSIISSVIHTVGGIVVVFEGKKILNFA